MAQRITYTYDDLLILLGCINQGDGTFESYVHQIAVRKNPICCLRTLFRVFGDGKKEYLTEGYLLSQIPFDQLPLYINKYPGLVKWRMQIGK